MIVNVDPYVSNNRFVFQCVPLGVHGRVVGEGGVADRGFGRPLMRVRVDLYFNVSPSAVMGGARGRWGGPLTSPCCLVSNLVFETFVRGYRHFSKCYFLPSAFMGCECGVC